MLGEVVAELVDVIHFRQLKLTNPILVMQNVTQRDLSSQDRNVAGVRLL